MSCRPSGPNTLLTSSALRSATSSRFRFPVARWCAQAASYRWPQLYSSWLITRLDQRDAPAKGRTWAGSMVRLVYR